MTSRRIRPGFWATHISFNFFTLPFVQEIVRVALILAFVALIGVVVLYYFKGDSILAPAAQCGRPKPQRHPLSVLAALVFVLLAISAYLDRYGVLFGEHDIFSGANYVDLHARIPMLNVLGVAALIGAVLVSQRLRVGKQGGDRRTSCM